MLYSLHPVTSAKLHPRTALILLTALNLLNYVDRSVLFAVQPLVQSEFQLSNTQVGYLTSAFLLFYMVAAPFVGPLADRYSRKLIIVGGAIFWSALTLLTAVTHTYTELLIRHTLVGIGEATFVTIAPTFVADLFPEQKRGRILGVFYLAIPVGTAAGYLLGGNLSPHYGWRFPFYVAAVPGFLTGAGCAAPARAGARTLRLGERNSRARDDSWLSAQSCLLDLDPRHGHDDLCPWRHTSMDAHIFVARAWLLAGVGELHVRDHHRRRRHSGVAGRGMARRLSPATHEGIVLLCFGSEHGSGRAFHDRSPVHARSGHGSCHRGGGLFLLLNTSPLNAAVINSVGAHIRATALAVNIFIFHLLGDVPSPTLMGYVADKRSLQAAFILPVIAMIASSAILFYGMRFASAVRFEGVIGAGAAVTRET